MDLTARKGVVFDIMRFCVHDGPGIRTTVFLKGCPLRCLWCHNPESQEMGIEISWRENRCLTCGDCAATCPSHAVEKVDGHILYDRSVCKRCGACVSTCLAGAREQVGREMTVAELMQQVTKDLPFFEESDGGVTFSGGEPVLQSVFLEASLAFCRRLGVHTAVETSGFTTPEILRRIAQHTDLFLFDIKHMDDLVHRQYTGVSNERILDNLRLLVSWQKPVIVRIPLVPGVNDDDENMRATAAFIASLRDVREVHLLPFHLIGRDKYERIGREYPMPSVEPPGAEKLQAIRTLFECQGLRVTIGG